MTSDDRRRRTAGGSCTDRSVERSWTHNVRVVGVTKGHGPWAIEAANDAGLDAIGENYAQEVVGKRSTIERLRPEVQFIGQLQSNKVRQLVDLVDLWASVDRPSIVDEVAKRAPGARVLLQVDTTGEPGKGGCRVEDLSALVDLARRRSLRVEGLLTVGPTRVRPTRRARVLRRALARRPIRPPGVLHGDVRRPGGGHRGGRDRGPHRLAALRSPVDDAMSATPVHLASSALG